MKIDSPSYLYHLISKPSTSNSTSNSKILPPIKANHKFIKNTLFPSTITEWKKLDSNIRFSPSYNLRKWILEYIRTCFSSTFNTPNSLGLTYHTGMRVGLSQLREQKFCHNFWDSLNLICNCSNDTELTKHNLLHCSNFQNIRQSNVEIVKPNLLSMNEDASTHLLLYGDNTLTDNTNNFPFKLFFWIHDIDKIFLTILWFCNRKSNTTWQ